MVSITGTDTIIHFMKYSMSDIGRKQLLHVHAKLGNICKAKLLLEEVGNVNITDEMLETPLHFAAWGATEKHIELVKFLLSKGATVDAQNIYGKTPLHKASRSNCFTTAEILLNHGADIENKGTTGMTPLHDACLVGSTEVVETLLIRGANVNVQDTSGDTPAHLASTYGHTSALRHLLAYGANINLQTSEGLTPLHVACYAGDKNLQVIDLLLENNARVDIKSSRGDTALHKAVLRSYIHQPNKIYEKLLENGACIDVRNNENETPYDICLIDLNDEEEELIKTALEKHIVKLKTAGFTVDIQLNADLELFKSFRGRCLEELEKMKNTKINNTISLNFIFVNLKNPWYLKNVDISRHLEEKLYSVDLLGSFPLYAHILRSTYVKTKQRFFLLEKAFISFSSEKRKNIWSKKLPDLVKLEVLDYLSNDDLENFYKSG